jgi:hypothetical protein
MSTYFHHIHLPSPFPYIPPPIGTNPQTGLVLPACSLFLKKRHFHLFNIQGVSLWHFHVYMYYNLNWLIPSIFLLSTLVPSYGDFTDLKVLYSFLYRQYINHIHLLNFLLLPSLSH